MLDLFGVGILQYAISFFMLFSDYTDTGMKDLSRMEDNRAAVFMAQSSIEKSAFDIRAGGNTKLATEKFATKSSAGPSEDLKFGIINGNYAGYFASELLTAPQEDVDLGSIAGSDVVFRETDSENLFDKMVINYDSDSKNEDLEVLVVRANRGPIARCTFAEFDSPSGCPSIRKFVINTTDGTQNGIVTMDGYTVDFGGGDAGYRKRIEIGGLSPLSYDYRIMFATLSGRSTPMSYYVTSGGTKKKLPDNIIEIDSTGLANDAYARFKLRKRIVDQSQPLNRYVLFGDEQIVK